jgi:hypothetical protein
MERQQNTALTGRTIDFMDISLSKIEDPSGGESRNRAIDGVEFCSSKPTPQRRSKKARANWGRETS